MFWSENMVTLSRQCSLCPALDITETLSHGTVLDTVDSLDRIVSALTRIAQILIIIHYTNNEKRDDF